MTKRKPSYQVQLNFPLTKWGGAGCYQVKIEKAAKRYCGGSGTDGSTRDLDFNFKTEVGARNTAARIKALKLRGLKMELYMWEDDAVSIVKL